MTKSAAVTLSESIAVVGMSGRYPQAKNLDQYWDNLRAGKECITFFTDEELLKEGLNPAVINSPNYVKARGYYEGTYNFDASFFGYNPREAELIDPQQRVFLECTWEALENAGYDPSTFPGRIGLFGGTGPTRQLIEIAANSYVKRSFGHLAIITSNDKDYLCTRIGYKLNFRGPCITLQTACSTSLVAICVACQNLLNYQCDMALAGGVTLVMNDKEGYFYDQGGIVSPDGHCRTFDAAGQGTLFSQGSGVVALKRFDDALAGRDNIHAVIRGFGLNNDGSARVGFSAPGVDGQTEVSSEAIEMAGVNPESIGFVECHGTATPMGDPIEIMALTKSFRRHTQKKRFCAVGSVKTNIGHTDAAAGVAGFTKAVLAVKNKAIPASLHFEKPNPQIDFENGPFFVNSELLEWKRGEEPRRAGVNSFGVGGTNAHVIVEEAPEPEPTSESRPFQLLVLSAKNNKALDEMTLRLADHIEQRPQDKLADVAFTQQIGRAIFPCRKMLVCRNREEAVEALRTNAPGKVFTAVQEKQGRKVSFLFPGQGSQYAGMGRQLYASEPSFRTKIDECAEILQKHLRRDIRELLFPAEEQVERANEQLEQTAFTQPALFVIEYALATQLMEWGLEPEAMLGHSIGEYVAACISGVFSLEDALGLVATRGRLMQDLPGGSMLGVMLPLTEASALLAASPELAIAAVNSPSTCVISGPTPAIENLQHALDAKRIPCRPLRTSHAFHSAMMDPILDRFRAEVHRVQLNPPTIPYVSNLTGTWITAAECTNADYWVHHLRNAVRFEEGLGELLKNPATLLLEVGPGRILSTLATQHPSQTPERTVVASLRHPKNDPQEELEFVLAAIGRLWLEGAAIDWQAFYQHEHRRRVALPTYPFQHERYRLAWPADAASNVDLGKKKSDLTDWFYYPSWKRAPKLRTQAIPQDASWILFLDDCGLGTQLAERLRALGQDVFTVTAEQEFERTGEYSFTLNPGKIEHYDALLKQFHSFDKTPANIVHLWGTVSNKERPELENADATMERTFYSLMFLAKALGSQYATTPIRLSVLSNDLFDVVGDAVVSPSRATLLGPCKTIPQEYRNISSRSIDVPIPENPKERAGLVETLITEFVAGNDDLVAYRGGHRWLQVFEPLAVQTPEGNSGLREGGVYLITGGMGGIGLVIAEYLAQAAHAKLVLIGRSAFPEKAQWPEWLAGHRSDDPVSVKIRKLQDLESLGAEVLLLRADVADSARMNEIVRLVKERFGAIHGVVHAAGIAGDGIIELKTKEISDEVLNPKVKGTLVLEEALQETRLDFFVLCSSVASLLPNPGQIDYTAANAFLDAYAYSKQNRAAGAPIAINWDRWDETGMAVTKAGVASAYSAGADKRKLEAIDHPIFSARTKDADGETYIFQLSPQHSWVIGEHKVGGYHTLVGTAYLEFARSAFAVRAEGPIEIRDVIFMFPLMMKHDDTREVEVRLRSSGGRSEFLIRSRLEGKPWQEHAMGKIAKAVGEAKTREHGLEVIERCKREVSVDFLNAKDGAHIPEQKFIQTGKRWKSLKTVHLGKDEGVATRSGSYDAIAKLQLPSEFVGDLAAYPLHPALMDQATGWAIDVVVQGVNYLPFSYKKVRINKPLLQTFYSYAKLMSDNYEEFMSFDLLVVDEQGEVIVEIETFDLKRMRGQMVFSGEVAGATTDSHAAGQADGAQQGLKRDRWGDHILTKEGIEVFRRILAMPPTPQIAVATKDFSYLLSESKPKDLKAEESGAQAPMLAALHSRPNLATPHVAPRNDLEESIAQIWQGVLGIDKVGVNDSFVELGGHSLMAIQLAARIREMFEIELSVAKLYNAPTVAGLAKAIVETLVEQSDASVMEQALQELEASTEAATEARELATSGAD